MNKILLLILSVTLLLPSSPSFSIDNYWQGVALAIGFGAAFISLIVLYWVMRSASLKLPMGLFFTGTAILLYGLAIMFAGRGILELQAAKWISITPVGSVPNISWLGLFPTVESMGAQVLLIAPLPLAFWALSRQRKKMVRA